MKNCYMIDFNSIGDENRGYLVALEENMNIPFTVRRVYYTYSVPSNEERGFHAHKKLEQVLICVNGSLKVRCFDGEKEETYILDTPNKGLYISDMVWREIYGYSEGCVLMVLASEYYIEDDYIRNYDEFIDLSNKLVLTYEK